MKNCNLFLDIIPCKQMYDETVPANLAMLVKIIIDGKVSLYFPTTLVCFNYVSPYMALLLPNRKNSTKYYAVKGNSNED